jgi:hypothetical protein
MKIGKFKIKRGRVLKVAWASLCLVVLLTMLFSSVYTGF